MLRENGGVAHHDNASDEVARLRAALQEKEIEALRLKLRNSDLEKEILQKQIALA